MAAAASALLPSFKVGGKELFLPNATLTFLRTQGMPANYAKFQVPLWFSKLDIRDYLWHAYKVEILNVRSYVKQSRVEAGKPHYVRPALRRWHRPRARKFMTVELSRPFVWPAEPEDYKEWNKEEAQASEKDSEVFSESMGPIADTSIGKDRREAMRDQAKALLEGKARWKPAFKPVVQPPISWSSKWT